MNVFLAIVAALLGAHTPGRAASAVHEAHKPAEPTCSATTWRATLTPGERFIVRRESGFDPSARNPVGTTTGHAYGLGQLTDTIRATASRSTGVPADTARPCGQIVLLRSYVLERYGNTTNAVAFWEAHGWY